MENDRCAVASVQAPELTWKVNCSATSSFLSMKDKGKRMLLRKGHDASVAKPIKTFNVSTCRMKGKSLEGEIGELKE